MLNFNKTSDEKIRDLIENTFKEYVGGEKEAFITHQPHYRFEGSNTPENLYDVYIAKSQRDFESGQYAVKTVGFYNNQPYIYQKPTYQTTSSGVIPFNVDEKKDLFYPVGAGNANYLEPYEHVASLLAMPFVGNPGGAKEEKRTKTLQEQLDTAINIGGNMSFMNPGFGRSNLKIPGLNVAVTPGMSSAELQSLTLGPQLAPQTRRDVGYGADEVAMQRVQAAANAGRVRGLPKDIYAIQDYRGGPQRLSPTLAFGQRNPLGVTEAFSANPLKAAHSDRRETAPLLEVGKRSADILISSMYAQNNAIMNQNDIVHSQLNVNAVIPLTELPTQSGTGIVQLPFDLRQQLRASGTHLEAGYLSQKSSDIMGIESPQDLFYTDSSGNKKLRLGIAGRFLPENRRQRNTIRAGQTVAIGYLAGMEGGRFKQARLNIGTEERPFSVTGMSLTIPEHWMRDSADFIRENLLPELARHDIQLEVGANRRDEAGYTLSLNALGYQHEGASFKGGISSKITSSPISLSSMGIWDVSKSGKMQLRSGIDAVVPAKVSDSLMWGLFRGQSRDIQKSMLLHGFSGKASEINSYLSELGEEPIVMSDLASRLGVGPIGMIKQLTSSIIGETPILQGGVINREILAQQEANFKRFGVGRTVGWIPFDSFTEDTRREYTEQVINTLMREGGLSRQQAISQVGSVIRFQQDTTLKGGQKVYTGYQYGEMIRANNTPLNTVLEWSGVARDTLDSVVRTMMIQGNTKIGRFLEENPHQMSSTQSALTEALSAHSASMLKSGEVVNGRYLRVSDDPTNVGSFVMNRGELSHTISRLSSSNRAPAQVISELSKEISNMFGTDRLGLQVVGPSGSGSAYFPSIQSIQRLDEIGMMVNIGAENELQEESIGRLSDRALSALTATVSGSELDFEAGKEQLVNSLGKYLKSPNLVKSEMGIYGAFSGSSLLKPGEIFLSQEALKRYYRVAGGDVNNRGEWNRFLGLFNSGVYGVAERQPKPNAGLEGLPGSVFPFSVVTAQNDPRGAEIERNMARSGIKTQDIVTSTLERATFGDLDADKFGLTLALARKDGEWSKLTGLDIDPIAQRTSENQQKSFDAVFGGVPGGSLEYDPFSKNVLDYFGAIFGTGTETLLHKRANQNIGDVWQAVNENVNFQKKIAMGSTYNQLLRRITSAGTALGLEPAMTQKVVDLLGTKSYQSAIDQKYTSQMLVNILQGAFLGGKNVGKNGPLGGSIEIGFNNVTQKGSQWNKGLFLNEKSGLGNVLVGLAGMMMENKDTLTPYNFATLLGQLPKDLIKSGNLSDEESNALARKQDAFYQGLSGKMEGIMKMPNMIDQERALNDLLESGEIGENSVLGEALGSRLYEYTQGTSKDRLERMKDLNYIASGFMKDGSLQDYLGKYYASSSLFSISKTDKNSQEIGAWKNPQQFAKMAFSWMKRGMSDTRYIRSVMGLFGSSEGFSYGEEGGEKVLYTPTGDVIRNQEDLDKFVGSVTPPASSEPASAGIPPSQPPTNQPPADSSFSASERKMGSFYNRFGQNISMSKAVQYDRFHRSVNSMLSGGLEGITNLATLYQDIGSAVYPSLGEDTIDLLSDAKGSTAYEAIRRQYGKASADYAFRNPIAGRALGLVRSVAKYGPNVLDQTTDSLERKIIMAVSGDEVAYKNLQESNPEIADALMFSEFGVSSKSSVPASFLDRQAIAQTNIGARNVMLTRGAYLQNKSATNKQAWTYAKAGFAASQASKTLYDVASIEAVLQIPNELRISSINQELSIPEITKQAVERKKRVLEDLDYGPAYEKEAIPSIEKYLKNISRSYEFESEGIGLQGKVVKENLAQGKFYRESLSELALSNASAKLKEFSEAVDKNTKSHEKQSKIVEIENKNRDEMVKAIRSQQGSAVSDIRGLIGSKETGQLTEAERILAAQTPEGTALLKEWRGYNEQIAGIEEQARAIQNQPSKWGTAARHIFGGFGLMYMRSIGNIIGSGGQFGYNESVGMEQGITTALSGGWGPNAGYNMDANLAGAKALYGGGGQRAFNALYNNLLRNAPGVIDTANALVAGAGAFGATTWFGGELASALGIGSKLLGPISLGVGAMVAGGTAIANQIGRVSDETGWIASNYENFVNQRNEFRLNYMSSSGAWSNTGARTLLSDYWAGNLVGLGVSNETTKQTEDNYRLSALAKQADDLVDSGKANSRQEALDQLGATDSDKYRLEKVWAYQFTTGNMKGISQEGRIGAVQAWESMGGTVDKPDYGVLQKLGQAYDSGINVSNLAQTFVTAGGFQYQTDRTAILSGLSNLKLNAPEVAQLQSVADFASQMGVGWTRKNLGMTVEDLAKSLTGELEPNMVTRTTGTPEEIQRLAEEVVKKQNIVDQLFEQQPDLKHPAFVLYPQRIQAQTDYDKAYKQLELALVPTTEQVPNELPENIKQIAGVLAGPNSTAAQAWFSYQKQMQSAGVNIGLGDMPSSFLDENLTPEQRLLQENKWLFAESTTSQISKYGSATGRDVGRLSRYWNKLVDYGDVQKLNQFSDLISSPTPLNVGAYVAGLSPTEGANFWNAQIPTIGGNVSAGYAAFTGVNQGGPNAGKVSGLSWGLASLALPQKSAQVVATEIWGNNWASSGGLANGAIQAMVNGFDLGGTTIYGQNALDAWQNQQSYNVSMAQAGVQMRQLALSSAFTTGVGLNKYSGTINPQTGQPFGFNASGGGFWGLEDRERTLSRQQQEYQFAQQQASMDMQNRFWSQDYALQRKSSATSRRYTQENWVYQEEVRDLQWGWKQEDYQENVRFLTGRDRRLAERQQKRDTIMHDLEGEQIDKTKKQQQEMWKLEDERFKIQKQQHTESVKFQQEELNKAKEFYRQQKIMEDESIKLQRAYWVEQQKLQKESAGISAHAAQVQKDLNDAMLKYKLYAQEADGKQNLLNSSLSNMVSVLHELVTVLNNDAIPKVKQLTTVSRSNSNSGQAQVQVGVYIDGNKVVDALTGRIISTIK